MAKSTNKRQTVDFSGVEARKVVPEGDHKVKAVEASMEDGDEYPYIAWTFEVVAGPAKGGKLYDNTSLSPKALWRLKTLLEAMGIEADGKTELDLKGWIKAGEEFVASVEQERYEGKLRSRIIEVMKAGEEEEEEEEDEEEKPKGKSEEEDEEEPDFDEMDADELEEFIDEHDLDVDLEDHKKLSAKRKAVAEAWEKREKDGDKEEEEEEESDVPDEDAIGEMGTKDLQALVDKYKLDVELDGTTSKKRRTVIKAMKAKKLIK